MKIGVISDTHVPDVAEAVPSEVIEIFRGVDLILHAGDIYIASVLDELQEIAPVLAARGDDDFPLDDERVQEIQRFKLEGLDFYMIHSSEFWARDVIKCPEKHDLEKAPDVVIFGHTHRYIIQNVNDSLLINPGSPTFPRYQYRLGTVCLLEVVNGKADAQIVKLTDRKDKQVILYGRE